MEKQNTQSMQDVWICRECGFKYSAAAGDTLNSIPIGTAWEDLDEDWFCPNCGADKSSFEKM